MDHVDAETLRRAAQLAGFDFAARDLEAIRPAIERALDALARLEALPLEGVEPSGRFGIV